MSLPTLRLKPSGDRRLRAGHCWIYSNEIDTAVNDLRGFEPGSQAVVESHRGKALGVAYVNPHTLIAARLVSGDAARGLDAALLRERLARALAWRERLYDAPYYRLVHGEGDGLPGLVVDRFGPTLVVQMSTAGMDRIADDIVSVLDEVADPEAIILRNDVTMRELEGLEQYVRVAHGDPGEELEIVENGVHFAIPALGGQKTGWYYDHRDNRARLAQWAQGLRVLDVFSYAGAWGIQAAVAGAREVVCVDSSAAAIEMLAANAERNGCVDTVSALQGTAVDALKSLAADGERFDAVVLDPPAFIKRRKDIKAGEAGYRHINELALKVLAPEGLLVSASCSMHLAAERLVDIVRGAAGHQRRFAQLVARGGQAPDHPVHPAIPETDYLKALFVRVAGGL